mmetsp:Transcript_18305/g.41837  ORF Transcript_18305/g.41837 Transcript_18305/m.41837 type:complete len:210 (-) Transcript_18305:604-1233(-)
MSTSPAALASSISRASLSAAPTCRATPRSSRSLESSTANSGETTHPIGSTPGLLPALAMALFASAMSHKSCRLRQTRTGTPGRSAALARRSLRAAHSSSEVWSWCLRPRIFPSAVSTAYREASPARLSSAALSLAVASRFSSAASSRRALLASLTAWSLVRRASLASAEQRLSRRFSCSCSRRRNRRATPTSSFSFSAARWRASASVCI